jgi:predicted Zn-ribbon and HTH transcriptional regulator
MKTKQTQRKRFINFILTYASDEIQTKKDALRLAKMSNKELLKDIQRIKKYFKYQGKEFDINFLY